MTRRGGWNGHRPAPRRRPPWWPEGEPFPPQGPPSWSWGRRRRGPGLLGVAAFVFLVIVTVNVVHFAVNAVLMIISPAGDRPGAGTYLLVALAVIVLLLLAATGRAVVRMAVAVRGLEDAARRVEAGDYSARVVERGPGETRAVARAFNAMSTRLQTDEERRRSVIADVTHELRTPLSVIRGQAEAVIDGVYAGDAARAATILESTHVLERLVEDIRTLAQSEVGSLGLAYEPVDVAVLINEATDSQRPAGEAAGLTFTVEAGELPVMEADPVRLRSVLTNLLANAIRHTPAGGSVTVSARRDGDHVLLSVLDTGAGIAPELLPRVTERFVKGAGSDGSGLGLAITSDLVRAHGGSIEVTSEVGRGTDVRVRIPVRRGTPQAF